MIKNYQWFIFAGLLLLSGLVLYSIFFLKHGNYTQKVSALPFYTGQLQEGSYRIQANGLEFRIRLAGMENKGENIILLHGFPESSIMWTALLDKASKAGYRVLAFDQRGYSPRARPLEVSRYLLDSLVIDVLAVANKAGFKKFHLVGHDWGSAVGWKTVMEYPKRIETWTALSIPHIGVFFKAVLQDSVQKKRSSYFKLFQTPEAPEKLFLANNQAGLKKILANLPKAHRNEYLSIFDESGAMTAALNWYRALNIERLVKEKALEKDITVPTLFIWGTEDETIAPNIIPLQKEFIKAYYKEIPIKAGHALVQHQEKVVLDAIMAHFKMK